MLPVPALALALPMAAPPAVAPLQTIQVERVATGLDEPLDLVAPPGDPRLFVVEKEGQVRIFVDDAILPVPFLDVSAVITQVGEGGLLALAFHLDFARNGRFFVSLSVGDPHGSSFLEEYTVSATDPNRANPLPDRIVYGPIDHTTTIHKAGDLAFGPDGCLYWSVGDGGPGNDENQRAQDLSVPWGKILRFDVDAPAPHVPPDNPFVGDPSGLDEIWAYGLRNPFRMSIDALTGDVWLGDVGQEQREEIDRLPAAAGGLNLGWRCLEGTHCTGLSGCDCGDADLWPPEFEYTGDEGCAVIGGVVYRGALFPEFVGRYFYTDFCNDRLQSILPLAAGGPDPIDHTLDLDYQTAGVFDTLAAIGTDASGELFTVDHNDGELFRLRPAPLRRYCSALRNSSGDPAAIEGEGSTSVTQNDLTLRVRQLPAAASGLFFYGSERAYQPLGDGALCVGGTLHRVATPVQAGAGGVLDLALDLSQAPLDVSLVAGSTWHFQLWFRDPDGPGGTGFHFSDGLSAGFVP